MGLITIGTFMAILFNNRISFSVLEYSHRNSINNSDISKKLTKGEKIVGEFKARENHLGIVSIKFKDFVKPDFRGEDVLQFRIKEKGELDWYYLNNYRSGLLKDQLVYPFGFPEIPNSQDKTYIYEIESLFGNNTNAVGLSDREIYTAYQIPKEFIMGGKMNLVNFIFTKAITSFTNINFLLSSTTYFLPFIFYLMWQLLLSRFDVAKRLLSTIALALIIANIFLIKEYYIGVFLVLLFLWIGCLKIYKLHSSVSFILAFILLVLWLTLNIFGIRDFESKLNIWTYTFLGIGIIQLLIEEKTNSKKGVRYKEFIGTFVKLK